MAPRESRSTFAEHAVAPGRSKCLLGEVCTEALSPSSPDFIKRQDANDGFAKWNEGGEINQVSVPAPNRSLSYSTGAVISASLAGFALVAMTVILSVASTPR